MDVYLTGVYIIRIHFIDIYFTRIYLTDVRISDRYIFNSIYLIGVKHLIGVYLISIYLKRNLRKEFDQRQNTIKLATEEKTYQEINGLHHSGGEHRRAARDARPDPGGSR
jgi:hypothetical protein